LPFRCAAASLAGKVGILSTRVTGRLLAFEEGPCSSASPVSADRATDVGAEPQQVQDAGASTTPRARGQKGPGYRLRVGRRRARPATLSTVAGLLVEVPVMLSLVWFANRAAHRFPAGDTASLCHGSKMDAGDWMPPRR